MSHLLQMRGLKLGEDIKIGNQILVASFTDAWIETMFEKLHLCNHLSHLLQMRGLKPYNPINYVHLPRRIFYRCVD